jgi:hypothetical protein
MCLSIGDNNRLMKVKMKVENHLKKFDGFVHADMLLND